MMTREQIIEMAKEAGMRFEPGLGVAMTDEQKLERFATRVRADYSNKHAQLWLKRIDLATKLAYVAGQLDMRERAAGVCEDRAAYHDQGDDDGPESRRGRSARACATDIRALPIEGGTE